MALGKIWHVYMCQQPFRSIGNTRGETMKNRCKALKVAIALLVALMMQLTRGQWTELHERIATTGGIQPIAYLYGIHPETTRFLLAMGEDLATSESLAERMQRVAARLVPVNARIPEATLQRLAARAGGWPPVPHPAAERPEAVERAGRGGTLLHLAAYRQDADTTHALLAAGADPNIANQAGMTPLHLAAHGPPRLTRWDLYGDEEYEVRTPEITRMLLQAGVDPNPRDNNGNTPLHFAAQWGHRRLVEPLLAGGADPLALNAQNQPPLGLAAAREQRERANDGVVHALHRTVEHRREQGHYGEQAWGGYW